ncbi:MAG: hypothetical protein H0U74_14675 [Bradymonadaceae bacterium]|nr:hypothetical protein [Lujinxingiaceae bacterium]
MGENAKSWGARLIRWLGPLDPSGLEPSVYLDTAVDGFVVHIAFGEGPPPVSGACREAALCQVTSLEHIEAVMVFARAQALPIDAWYCSGLASAPWRLHAMASWIARVTLGCAPSKFVVATDDLSAVQRQRLIDSLVRHGCRVEQGPELAAVQVVV